MEIHCELMSEAVSDELSVEKLGCRLAVAIDEAFIAAGWPSGEVYGSEAALCSRYGVSRRIYREAVRVLTMRGTARLRRGSSGLVITSPDPEIVADMLRGYAYLVGVTEEQRRQAQDFIGLLRSRLAQKPCEGSRDVALDFLSHFIDSQLHPGMPPEGAIKEKFRKSRAGQIALRILEQQISSAFTPGMRIGSEEQLSREYCADRSITRQAIRLLESSGLISSVPGRGKGLFATHPPSGPICRLLCCYFAAHKLSVSSAFDLFEAMSIETMSLLSQSADPNEIERLQVLMSGWSSEKPLRLGDMIAVEDGLLAGLRNPLIELMFRSMRGYVAPTIAQDDDDIVPGEVATCFADYTRQLLTALKLGDMTSAVESQRRKLARIRELEVYYHPDLSRRLQS
jgi:DNA-binding FadR family transcriptional regulator